jgi:arginine/ornithine N-succinyltransferase beta subunit
MFVTEETDVWKNACREACRLQNGSLYVSAERNGRGPGEFRSHCRAIMLAVQDGSYPAEVATAMRQKRMSEGRWKLNVWTRLRER